MHEVTRTWGSMLLFTGLKQGQTVSHFILNVAVLGKGL